MSDTITTADQTERAQVVTGLRQLADYLDTHPDIPARGFWNMLNFTHSDDGESAERAQVDHVADLLGTPVFDNTPNGGHYTARRTFGGVTYEFIHIPADYTARHLARRSYEDSVILDDPHREAR